MIHQYLPQIANSCISAPNLRPQFLLLDSGVYSLTQYTVSIPLEVDFSHIKSKFS